MRSDDFLSWFLQDVAPESWRKPGETVEQQQERLLNAILDCESKGDTNGAEKLAGELTRSLMDNGAMFKPKVPYGFTKTGEPNLAVVMENDLVLVLRKES